MTATQRRRALPAMYVGLSLTALAAIAPYVTGDRLTDHIRAGYPAYDQTQVDTATTTWLAVLTTIGLLGLGSWAWTIWAVRTRKGWARWAATAMFIVGTSVALSALTVKDTSGDVGLAPLLGWIGLLPCVAGLAVVTALWLRR